MGARLEVVWQPLPWSLAFKTGLIRNESDGEEKANAVAAMLRDARALSARFEALRGGDHRKDR